MPLKSSNPLDLNMTASKIEEDQQEEEEWEELPPIPPDGGWGWVVVMAALFCNIIVDGVCFSFGIFLIELQKFYGEGKGKTAWVGSLIPGLYLGTGPIVSALSNKFGCRIVTIVGAFSSAFFFFLSTFSPNVDVLIFLYGVMGGISLGLMYLPSIVIVGFYFDKKRSLATGLAVCGSGIGTMLFAPLGQALLENYGWQGSYWIISGLLLNGVACGAVFRPLEPRLVRRRPEVELQNMESIPKGIIMQKLIAEKNRQRTISTGSLDGTVITRENKLIKDPEDLRNTVLKSMILERLDEETPEDLHNNGSEPNIAAAADSMLGNGNLTGSKLEDVSAPVQSHGLSAKSLDYMAGSSDSSKFVSRVRSESSVSQSSGPSKRVRTVSTGSEGAPRSSEWRKGEIGSKGSLTILAPPRKAARPMYRQDIFYSGSIASIPEYKSMSDMNTYIASITSIPDIGTAEEDESCMGPVMEVLKNMFDLSIFKEISFILLCICSTFAMTGFFTPFIYIPALAMEELQEMPNKATFLLSILGISNTIGRILFGWINDRPWADCLLIHNMALLIAGIATCLVPIMKSYGLLVLYCVIFGACMAAFIALRSITLTELYGIHRLSNAFGLLLLFQGVSSLVGSPIAGIIYDQTQSYTVSFISSGLMMIIAALVALPCRRVSMWQHRKPSGMVAMRLLEQEAAHEAPHKSNNDNPPAPPND